MTQWRFPIGWITALCLIAGIALAASGTALAVDNNAKDVAEEKPVHASKDMSAWNNFVPPRDEKFDWIQLKSGEWLKGELNVLYNFSLEFDSDKLDLLTLDWDDIKQVRGAGLQRIRIEPSDGESEPFTVIGILNLVDDKATVRVGDKVQEFDRGQIISIAEGTKLWKGKISLGANVRGGNTDLVDSTFLANVMRRTARSRIVADYIGNSSRVENVRTSNYHRLNSFYDIFTTSKFFWRVISGEYFRDPFKNINHQVSADTSFGYHLIRSAKTEWEVSGGIGALYKRFVSVEPGQDIENVSPALGLGTRYKAALRSWIDFLFDFSFQIVDPDSGTYIHHLITTLESDLVGDFDLDISFVWDRVRDPQPEADGTVPEKDDYQLIVGIGYEF